jgi:hypothetical protein
LLRLVFDTAALRPLRRQSLRRTGISCPIRLRSHETLDRHKLDVVNQTRSNLFGWRGQFTPEFVAAL